MTTVKGTSQRTVGSERKKKSNRHCKATCEMLKEKEAREEFEAGGFRKGAEEQR